MEGKQFRTRMHGIVLLLAAVLAAYIGVLYYTQIVNGADYLAQSQRKLGGWETVESVRGQILDRNGQVLVTNHTTYQVGLDPSLMGDHENDILLRLISLCRKQGVTWTDTLPISQTAPFVYTFDTASASTRKNLGKLLPLMKWTDDDAAALITQMSSSDYTGTPPVLSANGLMTQMRKTYGVDSGLSDADARALVGILYELSLRSKDVTWSPYVFAKDVDIDFISVVKEEGMAGVSVDPATTREYATKYAAHLLGRVSLMNPDEWAIYKEKGYSMDDSVGKDGVEQAFESYLRGEKGTRAVETNAAGKVVNEAWLTDPETGQLLTPKPGDNVELTLDLGLQEIVENSMADQIPKLKSTQTRGAAAVVINVKDGGVLAMASYPTFDPTTLYSDSAIYTAAVNNPLNPLYNRATFGLYAPGSTFKMVTAIGALQEGIITPTTIIEDTGRYMYYPDPADQPMCWIYRQYHRTHGRINVSQAIEVSCNVFFYDTGRRLTIQLLDEYAGKFGLGKPTGIEIPEYTGHVAGPEYTESLGQTWHEGNVMYAAIGQENNQFTPLQLANYVATLANGGTHRAAHLLKEVKSSDNSQVLYTYPDTVLDNINITPENLEAVKKGMLAAAESSGYYKDLENRGIRVCAKTGSAQVSSASESNAVYVCFAPYDDPQIAIAIVVEKGGAGAELAGIASNIMNYYFNPGDAADQAVPDSAPNP